jgi:hypothetical protein
MLSARLHWIDDHDDARMGFLQIFRITISKVERKVYGNSF